METNLSQQRRIRSSPFDTTVNESKKVRSLSGLFYTKTMERLTNNLSQDINNLYDSFEKCTRDYNEFRKLNKDAVLRAEDVTEILDSLVKTSDALMKALMSEIDRVSKL